MRASTLKSQLDLDEKERLEALKSGGGDEGEGEAGEKKRKGRKAQHEGGEIRGIRPLTQAELIEAALEEEEKNKEALRDWLKKEEEKRELRRVGRKRVRGPRWTWVSRTVGGRLVEEVQAQAPVLQMEMDMEKEALSGKEVQKEGNEVPTAPTEVGNPGASGEAVNVGTATGRPLESTNKDTEPSDAPAETAGPALAAQSNLVARGDPAETGTTTTTIPSSGPAVPFEATEHGSPIPTSNGIPPITHGKDAVDAVPPHASPLASAPPSRTCEADTESASNTAIASTSDTSAPTLPPPDTAAGLSDNTTSRKATVPVTAATADSTISTPPDSSHDPAATLQPVIPPSTTQPAIPPPSATPAPETIPTLPTEATPAPSGPYTRNYIILSQVPGGLAGEMKLVLGDHVEWDRVKYIPGRARPLSMSSSLYPILS